jgi:hypothetical protein
MGVALDRLNLARRRRSTGDRAVDGGICLEALLGDDSPQELTYKLRLRAALLLGRTVDERQQIREDVRRFATSAARWCTVACAPPRTHRMMLRSLLVALRFAPKRCALRTIVQRNALPDFARWELTGGPCDNQDG